MANKPRLYWDTSVFIEYFDKDRKKPWYGIAKALLATAKRERFQICTSVITIAEASYIEPIEFVGKRFVGGHQRDLDMMWSDFPTILTVRTDATITKTARNLHRLALQTQLGQLNAADYMHIATAMFLKVGRINTIEPAWFPYAKYAEIPISWPEAPEEDVRRTLLDVPGAE